MISNVLCECGRVVSILHWVILLIFKSLIFETFESNFYLMSLSVLDSDHVNEPFVLSLLAANHLLNTFFLCVIKHFALSIFAWAFHFTIWRLINENLTLLVCKESLFRLEKPHNSTHLEPPTSNKLNKIKLSFKLSLCLLKKLEAFGLSAPLNEAFKEADRIEFLVNTEVSYQSRHQTLSFWVIHWGQIFFSKLSLSMTQLFFSVLTKVFELLWHNSDKVISKSGLKCIGIVWKHK